MIFAADFRKTENQRGSVPVGNGGEMVVPGKGRSIFRRKRIDCLKNGISTADLVTGSHPVDGNAVFLCGSDERGVHFVLRARGG